MTTSWRAILEMFVRAGRGLAAARAAGLVHRDFKPDNVLIGKDGRVRVSDCGLVGVGAALAPADQGPAAADDLALGRPRPAGALATSLTTTGAVMGTPFYMAPEQHLGRMVGALRAAAAPLSGCLGGMRRTSGSRGRLSFDGDGRAP